MHASISTSRWGDQFINITCLAALAINFLFFRWDFGTWLDVEVGACSGGGQERIGGMSWLERDRERITRENK
jgi:hypothetical protein